eukprot:CAMPEP_0173288332 /NCGR_PEP_ID=MMETSP1143-20121109/10351_1 /TAXON_ID=483371 /ORGANISM="non described non described, Strain CCMP2298" /LENGTH=124 /DNA_ID=CAMNT_0014227071 /DNA_START=223 /DNA_END=595 /DNA_ORIENTATION=+
MYGMPMYAVPMYGMPMFAMPMYVSKQYSRSSRRVGSSPAAAVRVPIVVVVEALDEAFELLGEPGLHTGDDFRSTRGGQVSLAQAGGGTRFELLAQQELLVQGGALSADDLRARPQFQGSDGRHV